MSVRSRGLGTVAVATAVVVLVLISDVAGAAKKTTIWAPTLHGLQKQVTLKGDLIVPQEETIADPSDCFVFVGGKRVAFSFSFTPRKDEPRAKLRLETMNSKPSRSRWTRNLKQGKKLTLSWTQTPRLGAHDKDAIKLSIYSSRGVHITSKSPARWYLYEAGTSGARACIKSHESD